MTKEERIQEEKKRLVKIFKDIPKSEFASIARLVDQLAFMTITLDDLIEKINTEPLVVETVNASQTFCKENPLLSSYNKMYANFLKGIQQLISLLPEETKSLNNSDDNDELMSYLKKKNRRLK